MADAKKHKENSSTTNYFLRLSPYDHHGKQVFRFVWVEDAVAPNRLEAVVEK